MNLNNIRYAHFQFNSVNSKLKASGFTIAYVRDLDSLSFAYTFCSKKDNFRKSTGRIYAGKTLNTFSELIDVSRTFHDEENKVGNICIADFLAESLSGLKNRFAFENVLSDQAVANLKFMDFKHSFISTLLRDIVLLTTY